MPERNDFWNPYRWVRVSDRAVEHDAPGYHHRLSGLSGRLWCELEALTPVFIGAGDGTGGFVRHAHNRQPYIPATSLKGVIRSLAEIVGNAAVPFPKDKVRVDERHQLAKAWTQNGLLDIAARMFGYLDGDNLFAGLVCFSDAELAGVHPQPNRWKQYEVAVGQPKPAHRAFYPGTDRRKFYHHHPGAEGLVHPHAGITQTAKVRPAPPGTRFRFTVDFANLRDTELDLLLYCLVLEEQATVTLTPATLGRGADREGVMLQGPLRHKLGGAKPHGAGSVRLRVGKLEARADPAARYRGRDAVEVWDGARVDEELRRRTAPFRERTDQTMQELRAMLIYTAKDPRQPIQYPTYGWFQTGSQTPLKPTT